jgi:hypothetical protein
VAYGLIKDIKGYHVHFLSSSNSSIEKISHAEQDVLSTVARTVRLTYSKHTTLSFFIIGSWIFLAARPPPTSYT